MSEAELVKRSMSSGPQGQNVEAVLNTDWVHLADNSLLHNQELTVPDSCTKHGSLWFLITEDEKMKTTIISLNKYKAKANSQLV